MRADRRRARRVAKLDAAHRARRALLRRERVPGAAVAARARHRRAGLGPRATADPRRQRDRRAARRPVDGAADRRGRARHRPYRHRRAREGALRLRRRRPLCACGRVFTARRRAAEAARGVRRVAKAEVGATRRAENEGRRRVPAAASRQRIGASAIRM
ncbi:hypothetical protein F01_350036 [Burkholderia cenocepacia]|nr:hypothetical protein F01_350036 [Burkholderia cenocepacia]